SGRRGRAGATDRARSARCRAVRALRLRCGTCQRVRRVDGCGRAASPFRSRNVGEGTAARRALPARRGFSRRACRNAAGERRRARVRPADHVVDRPAAHRAGDLDAGCGTRKSDVRSVMTPSPTMRRPSGLVEAGLVPEERFAEVERVAERYAVAITPAMAALIDAADPHDPIARQFLPDPGELDVQPDETADP